MKEVRATIDDATPRAVSDSCVIESDSVASRRSEQWWTCVAGHKDLCPQGRRRHQQCPARSYVEDGGRLAASSIANDYR
jgi:hypothetical protein